MDNPVDTVDKFLDNLFYPQFVDNLSTYPQVKPEIAPLEETMQAVNQTTEDMETQFVEAIFLEAPKQESDDEPDNEE